MNRRRLLNEAYKKTVTGNPAVAKSVARMYPDISFPGKTEQQQTIGRQLLSKEDLVTDISQPINGIMFVMNYDGSVNVKGTSTDKSIMWYNNILSRLQNGKECSYYSGNEFGKLRVIYSDGTPDKYLNTVMVDKSIMKSVTPCVQVESSEGTQNTTFFPMLNIGASVKPWEPYTGGKPSPSPEYPQDIVNAQSPVQVEISDGGENIQTVTITSDRPVTKWDRLTKKRDVWGWLYQTAYIESYNGEVITGEWQSTTGELSTEASVQYKTSPEFVPLSDEEQQLMNALRTNNPTTVVQNSIGTDVTLTYKTKRSLEVTT